MRTCLLGFLCCCFFVCSASEQSDAILIRRALQQYTEVYGGGKDSDALTSISVEGTQEQGGKIYDFLLRKKRPNMIRYRLSHGDSHVTTADDGNTGWMQSLEAGKLVTRKLSMREREAIQQEAVFEGPLFRHLEKRSNQIEYAGTEVVDQRDTYVFAVNEPNGKRILYYLDVEESHVLKLERLSEDNSVEVAVLYRDYKEVEGYPFAFEIETQIAGETVSLVKIQSILPNSGLLSFYFQMPNS